MRTFILVFAILTVFALIKLQYEFQLNVDHTATYDIVLLIVFQLARVILQTTLSVQRC